MNNRLKIVLALSTYMNGSKYLTHTAVESLKQTFKIEIYLFSTRRTHMGFIDLTSRQEIVTNNTRKFEGNLRLEDANIESLRCRILLFAQNLQITRTPWTVIADVSR